MKQSREPVPDPDNRPEAYKDPDVLENLYVRRGWRRQDIADHFDVPEHKVLTQLQRHNVERETKNSCAPSNGLAKRLFEIGKREAVQ